MNKTLAVGVVGATGAVGTEFLQLLRHLPVRKLVPMASARSVGKTVSFQGESLPIIAPTPAHFQGLDIVFFSAGASVSREIAPLAVKAGAIVIDNSSAFRMDPTVPLVVPEINKEAIRQHQGIIAVPNCTTIILLMGIFPIYQLSRLEQVIVSSYQAVSGAGQKGLFELESQLDHLAKGKPFEPLRAFPHPIAFNAIPQVDVFEEQGYTKEEMKLVRESRKILNDPDLNISGTCVRIPVKRAHSESVYLRTKRALSRQEIIDAFQKAPGVQFFSNDHAYPHPLFCSQKTDVFVGRLRPDLHYSQGYHLWIVGDQLLKGASWNAIQIAQALLTL